MKSLRLVFLFLPALGLVLATGGCGCDDDDDDNDTDADDDAASADDDNDDDYDWGDWWPPANGTSFIFEAEEYYGFSGDLEATVLGEEEFKGDMYTKVQLGDFTEDDIIGLYAWFDFSTPGEVGFAGAEIYWTNTVKADTEPNGVFDLDDPVYIYINPTLDDPQTDTGDGTWTIWGTPSTFDVSLTSTTLATDASVTVPYGTVDDCFKIKVDITEAFSEWPPFSGSATFHFHHDLGLVKLEGTMLMGFFLELKDIL